jgi:thiol-disulfide isomerase/thioredoxin
MPEAKTYASSDDMMQLMGASIMALPQWILEQRAAANPGGEQGGLMMPPSTIVSAALAGVETIDDLECDVVKVVRELDMSGLVVDGDAPEGMPQKMLLNETIAFARTDGMPRRLSMMPVMDELPDDEMGTPVGPSTTWTAVTVNSELAPEVFSTAAPEGFAKVDPPANPMMQGMALEGEGEMPEPGLAFKVGDAAPEFALKDLAGTEVTLASLKGKVVLLDFWATWCGPCKMAMPTMQKLHEEYASKGVAILGVNTWEKKADAAKAYMESKKFTYPCLLDGDKLAETYGIRGIPTLVVIGKDGKLALLEVGLSDASGNGLRKAIDAALAK